MADLLALGRRGQCEALERQAQAGRSAGGWSALDALELACAWLLAGDAHRADLAVLEADQLDPSLGLVPDLWGLWPPPPAMESPQRQAALDLADRFHAWSRPDPQALWHTLLPQLQADWRAALDGDSGDALLILGHATATAGMPDLDPPLEPELARLVADAEIAADPAASARYWQLVATIRPRWGLARIRAADLSLARGDLEASARWLGEPPAEALANPWFHDVAARHALQRGEVLRAVEAWAEAIRIARAGDDAAGMVALFEERRRDARRGPGVLQVRSLLQRGEPQAAAALLERLLAEDPQWAPLRSLREQLSPENGEPVAATTAGPVATPASAALAAPAASNLEGFSRLLDRAASRLQGLGQTLPAASPSPSIPADPETAQQEIEAFARRLSDYEARFALA